MRNFSEDQYLETERDATLKKLASLTGLPGNGIKKIYESMKIDKLSDRAIVEHFERQAKPKIAVTCSAFFGSIVNGLSGVEGKMSDVQKTGVTKGILQALDDFSSGVDNTMMEPTELLATVKNLLEIKNPKINDTLVKNGGEAMVLGSVEHDFSKLNEALSPNSGNDVMLYEGLKHILAKNNKRWGNAYRITNTYQAIMDFIDQENRDIQLGESITSIDDGFHIELINDLLSGSVNPIYKHINGVRQLIPDMQTLLFDLTLLVNRFMQDNQYAMEYLDRKNVNDYRTAARNLLASISSSRKASKILMADMMNASAKGPITGSTGQPQQIGGGFYQNFLEDCTNAIDSSRLKYNTWNISLKSVVDVLYLQKSMSSEFNLKIRPLLRDYITKALGITGRIERAKREMATFSINR